MSVLLCPHCGTPLRHDTLSCQNCGQHLTTESTLAVPTQAPRRLRLPLSIALISVMMLIAILSAYPLGLFYPAHSREDRAQITAHSVGQQEKVFLAERFVSPEGIALYRSMVDHELAKAEAHGSSLLLGDRLPKEMQVISARRLSDAYANDDIDADARYRNRTLLINAQIETLQRNIGTSPCLILYGRDRNHDVQACLRHTEQISSDLDYLQPHASRQLICRGEGAVMSSAMLGDCIPLLSVFRQRAQELRHSCITQMTRGQLFLRLRDASHPLHHTKPLMLILRAEYAMSTYPECRHGLSTACELMLRNLQDHQVDEWLHGFFAQHGIQY